MPVSFLGWVHQIVLPDSRVPSGWFQSCRDFSSHASKRMPSHIPTLFLTDAWVIRHSPIPPGTATTARDWFFPSPLHKLGAPHSSHHTVKVCPLMSSSIPLSHLSRETPCCFALAKHRHNLAAFLTSHPPNPMQRQQSFEKFADCGSSTKPCFVWLIISTCPGWLSIVYQPNSAPFIHGH